MELLRPVLAFLTITIGYTALSTLIQYVYYNSSSETKKTWKIQCHKDYSQGTWYSHPLISNAKLMRAEHHVILTTTNLLIASSFAFVVCELCLSGHSRMNFAPISEYGHQVWLDILIIVVHESIMEYYWHRMMHINYFYIRFHKLHHAYKSPEPFDDMYIHPVEAFGYYCILYSPPFIYSCHVYAFLAYMIIMGLCGICDHCGVKMEIPGLYNTKDHDAHHEKFEVNYSFPFPFMDILHGTYEGTIFGVTFHREQSKKINE